MWSGCQVQSCSAVSPSLFTSRCVVLTDRSLSFPSPSYTHLSGVITCVRVWKAGLLSWVCVLQLLLGHTLYFCFFTMAGLALAAKGGRLKWRGTVLRSWSRLPASLSLSSRRLCALWRHAGILLCLSVSYFSPDPHAQVTHDIRNTQACYSPELTIHLPWALQFSYSLAILWLHKVYSQCSSGLPFPAGHSILSYGSLRGLLIPQAQLSVEVVVFQCAENS